MSWAKFDANRAANDKGRPSSADKLAESIKSSLGHDATKGGVRRGGGGVVSRSVSGRSVVSRPVEGKSIVSTPGKKDFKRAAPVKGEKDRADSQRTKIRMAAHYRNKKGETAATGNIKPEGGNTGKIRSADKLVGDRNTREDRYAAARKEAVTATAKAELEGTAQSHRAAEQAHRKAGDLATDDLKQRAHDTRATGHSHEARQLEEAAHRESVEDSRIEKAQKAAKEAWALSAKAKTAAQHEAAAKAHGLAADLTDHQPKSEMHLRQALDHQSKADRLRAAAKERAASKAADKAAGKADQDALTDAGIEYKEARTAEIAARSRMYSGIGNRSENARAITAATDRMNKLWPRLTHRDVAESVVQYNKEIDPAIHESLVGEMTKHVAFTGKSSVWKRATVDVGDMRAHKFAAGSEAAKNPKNVLGVTVGGEHIILSGNLLGRNSFGEGNKKKWAFQTGWHTTSTLGPDDTGGHRATLSHEVGHVIHYSNNGYAEIPHTRGDHMSEYGNTSHHEGAAESYAAAFARAHGHQYSNDKAADIGDQMAAEARKRKA